MMKEPFVSVIVPVYKVERYLRTCVESVLSQSYKNFELILIDDGSPDNCPQICDEYSRLDSRVQVYHYENGGLSLARNRALDLPPKGEYVTFLDSDDFFHKDYLKVMVALCVENDADMSQCQFMRGTDTQFYGSGEKDKITICDNHSIFTSEKSSVCVCGKLYKTGLLDGIRMPVGLYNEDDWTAWKFYYRSKKIAVTERMLYYYTVNPSSIMNKSLKKPDLRYWGAYDERISFFKKKGENDLEHCSRLQLCKSLTLTYSNKMLNGSERKKVKEKFDESWAVLRHSNYIKFFYKVLFFAFNYMPLLTSKLANKIR